RVRSGRAAPSWLPPTEPALASTAILAPPGVDRTVVGGSVGVYGGPDAGEGLPSVSKARARYSPGTEVKRVRRLLAPLAIAAVLSISLTAAASATGSGAPSGPHFNLNIHGVANGQGWNGNNKNDIFVPLTGRCQINLSPGPYGFFSVTDPNCVSDHVAAFTLPNPCLDAQDHNTCTDTPSKFVYSVWARSMSPKGTSMMKTCYTDATGTYCNTSLAITFPMGKKFIDVSKNLLQVCAGGQQKAIFSDAL